MIGLTALLTLIAASASVPEVWVLQCEGRADALSDEEPRNRSMTIRFQRIGSKLSAVEIANPPTSGAYAPDTNTSSRDWRGKISKNRLVFRSTGSRSRYVEPGVIELSMRRDANSTFDLSWSSYISGGHINFSDSGSGACSRMPPPTVQADLGVSN